MLSEKMEKALNEQLNREIYAAHLYYSMAAYFTSEGMMGFANWMRIQAQEELSHVDKFFVYINDRRGQVKLDSIAKPPHKWDSALAVFEDAFKAEQSVSKYINDLVNLASELNDNATFNFLQWFVEEQVEEEGSVDDVIQKLKLIDGFGPGLFMLDREMGTRTLEPTA